MCPHSSCSCKLDYWHWCLLLPMAVLNTTHLYNHLPNNCGLCPGDLFTGSMVPWHYLNELHIWDILFIFLTFSYRQANSFLNGNLNLDVAIFLALATFIQVRFPLCTTCKPAVSLPNITLLLTIFLHYQCNCNRRTTTWALGGVKSWKFNVYCYWGFRTSVSTTLAPKCYR